MNEKFLSVLRCPEPDCGGRLEVAERTEAHGDRLVDGTLRCRSCERTYRVVDGFPILLAEALDDDSDLQDVDPDRLREFE